jgi:hypothetical protein
MRLSVASSISQFDAFATLAELQDDLAGDFVLASPPMPTVDFKIFRTDLTAAMTLAYAFGRRLSPELDDFNRRVQISVARGSLPVLVAPRIVAATELPANVEVSVAEVSTPSSTTLSRTMNLVPIVEIPRRKFCLT